jgi:calcineurin-like phosphoesterase family protein
MAQDDLMAILKTSRKNNKPRNITGLLLYRDGHFLQVLEGPEHAVKELYEVIKQDERHQNVKTLMEGDKTLRDFGDWEMGFEDISNIADDELDGISLFMEGNFDPDQAGMRSRVWAFLEVFRGIATP